MSRGKQDPAEDPLQVGDLILERYRIVDLLDTGVHSVVYRGMDERLARPVCVKVFRKMVVGGRVYRISHMQFVQEAFALSKLTHPNTLRIYDFGNLPAAFPAGKGAPFQVTEFMVGGNLAQMVRKHGRFSSAETLGVVKPLCGALAEAHQMGIVHRDIKPKNILFGSGGLSQPPKLADFSIAKVHSVFKDSSSEYEDTQVVAGKPLIMYSPGWAAPEQIVGEPVGPMTDTYSLALVTFFLLTGRMVFKASRGTESYQIRKASDVMVDEAAEACEVSAGIRQLVKRALSFDPTRRFQDAQSFAEALDAAFAGRKQPVPEVVGHDTAPGMLRLDPGKGAQQVAGHRVRFVDPGAEGADVGCLQEKVRLRISLLPGAASQSYVHVKGLNCFVSCDGGRPSPATQFRKAGCLGLVSPKHESLASVDVVFASRSGDDMIFEVDSVVVAIAADRCQQAVALDFGSEGELLIVFASPEGSQ